MALNGTSRIKVGDKPRNNDDIPSERIIERNSDTMPASIVEACVAANPTLAACRVRSSSKGAVDNDATNRAEAPARAGTIDSVG